MTNLNFGPVVGYFMMPNVEVGAALDYWTEECEYGGDETDCESMEGKSGYGLAAFANYHYLLSGTLFATFGGKAGYASALMGEDPDTTAAGPYFGAKAGVTQTFGGKFGGWIFAGATYDYHMVTVTSDAQGAEDEDATRTKLMVGTGLGVFF